MSEPMEKRKIKSLWYNQRERQLRQQALGLCQKCDNKAVQGRNCYEHAIWQREYQRKKTKAKKRYKSATYKLRKP